jgi:hypothetical protein
MEDGWILARSIEYVFSTLATHQSSFSKQEGLEKVLSIFDTIRSPYYARMYVLSFPIQLDVRELTWIFIQVSTSRQHESQIRWSCRYI